MSIVESLPTYGVHYYAVKVRDLIGWKVVKLALKFLKVLIFFFLISLKIFGGVGVGEGLARKIACSGVVEQWDFP